MKAILLILSCTLCNLLYSSVNANYLYTPSICLGTESCFKNQSTTDGSAFKSWYWDFGDSEHDTNLNPCHTYKKAGTYILKLVATNMAGDKDSMLKSITIKVNPKADFKANDICEPDTMFFINESTNATHYKWKFGDGNSSTDKSPKHLYDFSQFHLGKVTLVAYNTNGCRDSIFKQLNINAAPKSEFDYTHSGGTFNFMAKQAGNPKYLWQFGDGDSTLGYSVSHTYKDNPQGKKVCLKSTNAAACISETCKLLATTGIYYTKTSGFKIYPNPNSGNFTIELDNPEKDMSIEIYNLLGERVKRVELVRKHTLVDLDIASGIYLAKVRNGEMDYYHKVVIN